MKNLPTRLLTSSLIAALVSTATLSSAQEIPAPQTASTASRIALVAEAGTAGFGPSLVITASKKVTFTVGYTWLDYDYDVDSDDASYNGQLNLSNFKAVANWHPSGGSFHLSGGVYLSDNTIDLTAKLKSGNTYEINGVSYNNTQVSSLSGLATFADDVAPYVGIGWAKSPANSGFAFYADIGVIFCGDASVRFSATGSATGTQSFKDNLRQEENEINDDLSSLSVYPVLQLGVMYRF